MGYESSGYSFWFEELLDEMGHIGSVKDPAAILRRVPRLQEEQSSTWLIILC